jgi:hypothetical protein
MRQGSKDERLNDAARLARKIIALPPGEVPALIRRMLLERKLSRSVAALDEMIMKQPELKDLGARALDRMGLWWEPDRMA